jgi:hypothetical protein
VAIEYRIQQVQPGQLQNGAVQGGGGVYWRRDKFAENLLKNHMSPLQKQLRSQAPWLFDELGMNVNRDSYDPHAFGNSIVVLQSKSMTMRFVRDRGQIFAEFEPLSEPGKWFDLGSVLEAIHGTPPQPIFDLDGVISQLRQNFTDIVEALGTRWARTKQELGRRRAERLEALRSTSTRREGKPTD